MLFRRKKKKIKKPEDIAKARFIRNAIIIAILLVACFYGIRSFYRFMVGWDSRMHQNFQSLEMNSPISIAEEMMGAPRRISEYELERFPAIGYKDIKNESVKSGAVTFYYYENGMRALYILGFDAKGRMVFKKHVKV
ncbi:hypothetical protein JW926_14540 [Candidatus Sumerlaeota bacterium]|nr:hypothetical protein [Candidatus Sumerlaeota bacterium]